VIVIDGEEYLTAEEAARLLGVKLASFYAYVSRGRVESYRQGMKRRRLYRRSDVEALLEVHPASSAGAGAELPKADDWIPYTN
jgi:citrate synthase